MKKKKKEETVRPSYPLGKVIIKTIDYLLQNKFRFVIFKSQLKNDLTLIVEQNSQIDGTYRLQTFDGNQEVIIKGRIFKDEKIADAINLQHEIPLILADSKPSKYMQQQEYESYVSKIITQIESGKLSKCVAARKKKIMLSSEFNVAESFVNLQLNSFEAYCYLANTSLGLWMGASPELLLYKKDQRYFTVSLAGTKKVKEKRAWTDKEKVEQKIVTDYILATLKENKASEIEVSPVFETRAAHLNHLKTDINFKSKKSLYKQLHPTPAVCGIPLQKAQQFILENEGNTRSLYSGYLGLDGENSGYYVNLRCVQIFDKYADIYVGAGITINSDPTQEWKETENKSKVMSRNLT